MGLSKYEVRITVVGIISNPIITIVTVSISLVTIQVSRRTQEAQGRNNEMAFRGHLTIAALTALLNPLEPKP